MAAREDINDLLRQWSSEHAVTMIWVGDTLRLEDAKGVGQAVAKFPKGWLESFEQLSQSRRDEVLHAVRLDITLLYDSEWNRQFAKIIDIPPSYLVDSP